MLFPSAGQEVRCFSGWWCRNLCLETLLMLFAICDGIVAILFQWWPRVQNDMEWTPKQEGCMCRFAA
eukprot:4362062-Amphidinium_carterae.1